MTRRRPDLRAYLGRRWRVLGLILVLLAGSLFLVVLTDRGHDPLWAVRGSLVDEAVVSPDGTIVYTLLQEAGNVSRLDARSASDGALLWDIPQNASKAFLGASDAGVVVATSFPRWILTFYGTDGTTDGAPLRPEALEGPPRAMAVEGTRVAVALTLPPSNPVFVFAEGRPPVSIPFDSVVTALDLRAGRVAAGTATGDVKVFLANGSLVVNATLPTSVHSLRLSADGAFLLAGGSSLAPGDLSGVVGLVDVSHPEKPRWSHKTELGVGLVDMDAAGVLALSVEDSTARHTLRVFDAGTGTPRWGRMGDDVVSRDDSGGWGAAAISPDGKLVVAATLSGPLEAFSGTSGDPLWSYGSEGSTVVAFARAAPSVLVANGGLVQSGPPDALFLFAADREPPTGSLPLVGAALVVAAAATAAAVLGVGYWRVRRSY